MTPFVISIILASTFMHAGWNLLSRFARSERNFYHRMIMVTVAVGFLPTLFSEAMTRSLTPLAWACVAGSGFSAGLYLYSLARAYETSDFSVAYPVARALPVIFVAFGDVIRGRLLTEIGWLGILMVAAGCVLVPLKSLRDIKINKYINLATLWMFLAALGTVGYTMLDKIAAEVILQGPATAARYGYIYFTMSFLPYTALMNIPGHTPNNPSRVPWKLIIPAAILNFSAYWLILWAYQLTPYASYIVAFRQFSIVIGAALAFILFKEGGVRVRLSGAMMITAGLILIALRGW